MPVFVVIATKNPQAIGEKIYADHPDSHLKIKDDVWLIDCKSTTRELAEALGMRSGVSGSGLVILMGNYSGRASADVWEWLNLHMSADT
jgi:hypothetical protein